MSEKSITFSVEGMMCNGCVSHVEKALQQVPNVNDVAVDLEEEEATLTFSKTIDIDMLAAAVEAAGYKVVVDTTPPTSQP